jgi:hypothetical protein
MGQTLAHVTKPIESEAELEAARARLKNAVVTGGSMEPATDCALVDALCNAVDLQLRAGRAAREFRGTTIGGD